MENPITKEDLHLLSQTSIPELKELFTTQSSEISLDWLKAKEARQLLCISTV
ncbi:hypothetical protein [Myroides odoratus]|uniref:hypothetical protein n=1 Tax=Myroides odoratus TaxID=256 RepID=UPI0039AF50AE